MPRLKWIEVTGFRSFGIEQSLIFDEEIALIWGGNSQGKTSVAEAIEFLLAGTVVRPVMLGGAKNEYDRSLRNAYQPQKEPTIVRAGIEDETGTVRRVERLLKVDFGRGQDCATQLTIDGVEAEDLSLIGLVLAEPPLRAPVLFQHSIRYALSASPSERLTYFKALFEIGDLDALADAVKTVIESLSEPPLTMAAELTTCSNDAQIRLSLGDLLNELPPTYSGLEDRASDACRVGIRTLANVDGATGASLSELRNQLGLAIEKVQRGRFDLTPWRPGSTPTTAATRLDATRAYADAATRIDREVEQVRAVYEALLRVPAYEHLEAGVRCPVCDDGALSPARLRVLRDEVTVGTDLRERQRAARQELQEIARNLRGTGEMAASVVPLAATFDDGRLAQAEAGATTVLGETVHLSQGRDYARTLEVSAKRIGDSVQSAQELAIHAVADVDALANINSDELAEALANVAAACASAAEARTQFLNEVGQSLRRVSEALNEQVGTSGWDALLRLSDATEEIATDLQRRHAIRVAKREFSDAHTAIERAKLNVLRDKFTGMSSEIHTWWSRLRPDEPVVFERAEPRAGGRRFVDLKAKLTAGGIVEERDALGIFSDSQLNALGLAAFLARATLQGVPFVVLDDPVQAGDDEHRDTFIDVVLPALVERGLQVIVTSHDSQMRTLLANAHPTDGFTVTLDEPEKGTVVIRGTDTAEALLDEAKGFIKETPSLRATGAQKLRVAAERTAKEILVQKRQKAGERASLGDYKKWTLEKLVPKLCAVLDDGKEQGNWKNFSLRLSPAVHDDAPPPKNMLKIVRDQLINSHKRHIKDVRTWKS